MPWLRKASRTNTLCTLPARRSTSRGCGIRSKTASHAIPTASPSRSAMYAMWLSSREPHQSRNAPSNSACDRPYSPRSSVRQIQRSRASAAVSAMPARRMVAPESFGWVTPRLSHSCGAIRRRRRCRVVVPCGAMAAEPDPVFPVGNPDERELLLGWLTWLRGAVLRKVDGLSDAQARWTPAGKLISLLGIVNHLTNVEWRWIDGAMLGWTTIDRLEQEFRA